MNTRKHPPEEQIVDVKEIDSLKTDYDYSEYGDDTEMEHCSTSEGVLDFWNNSDDAVWDSV